MEDEATRLLRELLVKVTAQGDELRAIKAAGQRAPSGKTLRELYELDEAGWAAMSWAMHMRGIYKPALAHFGDRVADTLTRADWIYFRDQIRAKQITKRKAVPTIYTLNYETRQWRGLLRRQAEEGNCTLNPLVGVRPIRGEKKHRETEPTVGDLERLRPHCTDQLWAFVLLAFRRGFRASEARKLEWRQVDLERGVVTLRASQEKTRRGGQLRITSDVVEALRAIKTDMGRYVFPGKSGPLAATTLWRRVRAAIDAAGLEAAPEDRRMTYHDFRHGFVSGAARKLPLQIAMRLSRHKSLSAAQRYMHTNEQDLEVAYEVLEQDARKPARQAHTDSTGIVETEKVRSQPKP